MAVSNWNKLKQKLQKEPSDNKIISSNHGIDGLSRKRKRTDLIEAVSVSKGDNSKAGEGGVIVKDSQFISKKQKEKYIAIDCEMVG